MTQHNNPKPRKPSIIDSIISDVENANIFKLVSSSFRAWYTSWPWMILSVLLDFIFLIATGVTVTVVQFTLFEHLDALMTMAGEATGGLMQIYNQTGAVTQGLVGMSNSEMFSYHLNIIFKYLGLMILAVFIFWIIFQGLSWYIAHRMSTKKPQKFLLFWKNFALQSLPFYLVSIGLIFASVRLIFALKISITPLISPDSLNLIFIILVMITWYFGTMCYTIIGKYAYRNFRKCFSYGIKKLPKIIQSFAFIGVLFLLLDLILKISFIRNDPFVLMIVGTIIFMPAIVFARILLFKTTKEYLR